MSSRCNFTFPNNFDNVCKASSSDSSATPLSSRCGSYEILDWTHHHKIILEKTTRIPLDSPARRRHFSHIISICATLFRRDPWPALEPVDFLSASAQVSNRSDRWARGFHPPT